MEASLKSTYPILKEATLRNLLKGIPLNAIDNTHRIINIKEHLDGPYYFACILKIDKYNQFLQKYNTEDQILFRFAICNISQELISQHYKCDAVNMGDDHIVVLSQCITSTIDRNFFNTLSHIQNIIKEHFNFTVSIGIGDIVSSVENINISYESAMEYIKHRLFLGHNCITDSSVTTPNRDSINQYPYLIEKKIIEYINLNRLDKIHEATQSFLRKFV